MQPNPWRTLLVTLAHDERFVKLAAHPAAFGFGMFEASLRYWRAGIDAMREMIRTQQDAAFSLARSVALRGDVSSNVLTTETDAPEAQGGERRA